MISYLRGYILDADLETVTLDVSGVGYELSCSSMTVADLSTHLGSEKPITLWVYTHVREDALQLFGFVSKTEKQIFLSLIKVNGVGPKMALKILSGAPVSALMTMIENGDVRGLSQLPKVGKKTAEQIILTLKGKLVLAPDPETLSLLPISPHDEILSALVHLGYKEAHALKVVGGLPKEIGIEEGVRRALSAMTSI